MGFPPLSSSPFGRGWHTPFVVFPSSRIRPEVLKHLEGWSSVATIDVGRLVCMLTLACWDWEASDGAAVPRIVCYTIAGPWVPPLSPRAADVRPVQGCWLALHGSCGCWRYLGSCTSSTSSFHLGTGVGFCLFMCAFGILSTD